MSILFLSICFLLVNAYTRYPVISAKMQPEDKNDKSCSTYATALKVINTNDPSRPCGYILLCDDGLALQPFGFHKKFTFEQGQRVRIGYTIDGPGGFILECDPPIPPTQPVYSARIFCIQEVKK